MAARFEVLELQLLVLLESVSLALRSGVVVLESLSKRIGFHLGRS